MACDYSPFELIGHAKMKKASSISEAIDMYYLEKDRFIDLDNKKQRLKTIIGSALTHATRKAELHMADKDEGSKDEKKVVEELEKNAEWRSLKEKAAAIDAEFEKHRKEMLAHVRRQMNQGNLSK